ncbi:DNA repair exonuclease SbcCD ATPase subunit [Paenibacillus sp. 1182]|uniref:hypothetical protein n=1 Tax=Paenibacillus sp. 1182 TaxID=2806565 RepID=UPI001AE13440|nr:hypothetical protein [Paenibacillus sp. 1182]MBP1308803.1 DNA repair exonuclease SbcCD ATPase subunit [Paenibacillus sp. 1182]
MRNWTYSEHDGKHIINDDRGVLVAMVCDAQTAELIVRQHKELAEAVKVRNWKYSEHDGKHIINDDRGVLVAMVVDAQTAELIVRQHKRLADERIITLPDGLEPMSGDDLQTIWNKADNARSDEAYLSDDVFDLVNALEAAYAQIDSLQHQLIQKDREMSHVSERLKFIDDGMDKTVAGFDRVVAQRDDLKKQLAERDRTIAQLQEMDALHTSGAKQLVQDLHTLRMDRDELRKALEEIAAEEMLIGSTPVKMRHIARKALGRE